MTLGARPTADPALLDDEHLSYRDSARAFLARHVVPGYAAWGKTRTIPRELLQRAAEDGFFGMSVPETFGGLEVADPRFGAVLAAVGMEAGTPALALVLARHNDVAVPLLTRFGTDALRERWLGGMATGEVLAAVVEGSVTVDGGVIDGSAAFVVAGAQADLLLVVAGDEVVLVDPAESGVRIAPSPAGVGLDAAAFADITFERVPGVALSPGAAAEAAIALDLTHAVTAAGGAQAALALSVEYVRDRRVFGVSLATLENTRTVVAGMASSAGSASAFADSCLRARVEGRLTAPVAAAAAHHCIHSYCAVVDAGVQLHGGYGYILEYPIAQAYADAQFWQLQGGVAQLRREAIAAPLLD